ncbi:MAG: sulfotransferase [Steroidobacteraceae bacterium]
MPPEHTGGTAGGSGKRESAVAQAELNPHSPSVESEVLRARALLERRQFAAALEVAQALLSRVPENRDVLYLIAVCQRYLGRIRDALTTLEHFETLHPTYGRLFQERGHCLRAVGETGAALAAYQRAVALNGALPASWNALAQLCRAAGRVAEAQAAEKFAQHMATLPTAIVTATSLFAEGETFAAEKMVRQFLQQHGDHIEGMRLLAQIGVELDVLDDAEFLLESVLVFAPDYNAARYEYASVLSKRHKHQQALEQIRKLQALEPDNQAFRTIEGNACVGLGDHARALQIFRQLATAAPDKEDLHLSIGHALKTMGQQVEAIAAYRTAAAIRPNYGDAYWSLANLKTYRFTEDELHRMRAEEAAAGTPLVDRYHLCFALGKALEDAAEYAESFRYYEQGNRLKKGEVRYRPELIERNTSLQKSTCTAEFFHARRGWGSPGGRPPGEPADQPDGEPNGQPIFIVGLPRAGSTLLEQILASHSQVEGTMELANIPRLVQQLQPRADDAGSHYSAALTQLSAGQARQFGDKYLADTRVYRTGKPFFIDKMPNNFRHIGLIHLILPNAKIIDARREPLACCFSNFKQLFANGQEFTYSLQDIGRYYRTYVELMQHWDEVLPGKVLRVQHEEVVEDLQGSVCRLLQFCGLQFEPACLEFWKTERHVRTASSEQVRQPLFKEGLNQWRNFEPWLAPLQEALS